MKNIQVIPLIFLALSASCGKVEHEVTGEADVNVNFNFNLKEIESYFLAFCESIRDPNPTQCAKVKTAEFLEYMLSLQKDVGHG